MKKRFNNCILLLLILSLLLIAGSCENPDWDKKKIDAEGGGFFAIWGSSSSDVYAVGGGDIITHFDGAAWTRMKSGIDKYESVEAVWGSSFSNVFALSGNYILHYDGSDASQTIKCSIDDNAHPFLWLTVAGIPVLNELTAKP